MKTDQKTSFVLTEHARSDWQKEVMEKIKADGVCPFCGENFLKYHTKPIIEETEHWIITENFEPYEGSRFHYLFVYKAAHINTPGEMTPESQIELFKIIDRLTKDNQIVGGSILMRFGDGEVNGSSVEHLHAHLVVGEKRSEDTEALKVKLGYKKRS